MKIGNINMKPYSLSRQALQFEKLNQSKGVNQREDSNNASKGIFNSGIFNKQLEGLMEQKQNIIDNKNKYMEFALENGENQDLMRDRLKSYDEKINELELAMTELKMKAKEDALNNTSARDKDELLKKNDDNNAAEDSIKNLNGIANTIDNTEKLMYIKDSKINRVKILEREISVDISRGANLKFKANEVQKAKKDINNIDSKLKENMKDIRRGSNSILEEDSEDNNEKDQNQNEGFDLKI